MFLVFFFRLFFSCVWVCVFRCLFCSSWVSEWLNEWLRAERINFTLITLTILLYIREHKYVLACVVVRVVIISIISRAVIVISCRCLWSVCDVLWHITLYDGCLKCITRETGIVALVFRSLALAYAKLRYKPDTSIHPSSNQITFNTYVIANR